MEIKVENNVMSIDAPLSAGTPSSSGKNLVVASTNGFIEVEGTPYKVSLNVIKKRS